MAYKNMSDIIDNIGDTVDVVSVVCPVCNYKAGGDYFIRETALIKLEDTMDILVKWISVKDRLPEIPKEKLYGEYGGVECLVVANTNKLTTLCMKYVKTIVRKEAVYRWEWNNRISPYEVLYWMPLPEPPDEQF